MCLIEIFILDIRPIFVQVQERHSASPICFNLSNSLYSSAIDIVANVISSKLSADNPSMVNEERMKIIKEYKTRYWLQAFGCEERLFGIKPLIQSRVRLIIEFQMKRYLNTYYRRLTSEGICLDEKTLLRRYLCPKTKPEMIRLVSALFSSYVHCHEPVWKKTIRRRIILGFVYCIEWHKSRLKRFSGHR
jgi:hypothetical protein